jgi:hypothetical protein
MISFQIWNLELVDCRAAGLGVPIALNAALISNSWDA